MSNRGARLIGSAVVTLGGAVTLGLSLAAKREDATGGEIAGSLIFLVGAILFLVDWLASWKEDKKP